MVNKTIKATVRFEIDLTSSEYYNFVGAFYSCTENTKINREQGEKYLNDRIKFSFIKEQLKKIDILKFSNRGQTMIYELDIVLESSYDSSKTESDFRSNVYEFFKYILPKKNYTLDIKNLNYFDNLSEINMNNKYYMVLKKDMNVIYHEALTRKFKIGEQRVDRLFYTPTFFDENDNEYEPKRTEDFFENNDQIHDMSGYIVCTELGLSYFLCEISNSNVRIFECQCGGDCIDISPNIKRFETVMLTKEFIFDEIKDRIKQLNLSFDLNKILFFDENLYKNEMDIFEDIKDKSRKFIFASTMQFNEFRKEVEQKISYCLKDPFVGQAIMKIYKGYKNDGLYRYIDKILQYHSRNTLLDHSKPMYLSLSQLISIFNYIDFSDYCKQDFYLGSELIENSIFPILNSGNIGIYNSYHQSKNIDF